MLLRYSHAQGHVARNPKRVVERNLAAGLLAVAEHANEQAFLLLGQARELNTGILSADDHLRLLEGLGRACALTGRLDAAFAHLQQALHQAKTQADRFRLQNLLTLSYASQGRNDDALASLMDAFYQAAAQCGGDWWWHWTRPDGATLILLGDVSGHGAGPAMLTSAVSGTFQALTKLFPMMDPPQLLEHLSSRVKTFQGYHMTMSIALVDPSNGTLSWWNAGGPEIYLIRGGKVSALSAAGSVLGTPGSLKVGMAQAPIGAQDRVLFCTDGLLEMRRNGRLLGTRQVSKMFAATQNLPVEQASGQLGKEVQAILVGQEQEDDITFVLFEVS